MKGYYKLPIINYQIATHEGDAKRRLASQAALLLPIPTSIVPREYQTRFAELKQLIDEEFKLSDALHYRTPWIPTGKKLSDIKNSTAIKYIALLIEIEEKTRYRTSLY